jgi:hypothetical protein
MATCGGTRRVSDNLILANDGRNYTTNWLTQGWAGCDFTLSPQPDDWTKSYPTLRKDLVEDPGDTLNIGKLEKFGPLHHNAFSF